MSHQYGFRGNPEEVRQRGNCLAAAIHKGGRDQQTNIVALVAELAHTAEIFALSAEVDALAAGQALNKKGSRVMPRLFVFSAWITQADDQLDGSHDGSPSLGRRVNYSASFATREAWMLAIGRSLP